MPAGKRDKKNTGGKKSKSSRQWLAEHFADPYVRQARAQGYRSRSAYKLLELQRRYRLFRPGDIVVDLGAAPGGFSQVVAQIVGKEGRVFALDRQPCQALPNTEFIQGDFTDPAITEKLRAAIGEKKINYVICDIAPDMSGVNTVDQARVMVLCELALEFAASVLDGQGGFIIKVFQGEGFEAFLKALRMRFPSVMIRKPEASRNRSREVYLLAGCIRAHHNLQKKQQQRKKKGVQGE